jgi:3-oxoacyl-[acyl-carrier protein] reductase
MTKSKRIMIITGSRKGIGRYLSEYYLERGWTVAGCSREDCDLKHDDYHHYNVDVASESQVKKMVFDISKRFGQANVLLNNAGIASMNHILLTPFTTTRRVFETNVFGTFLFCREVAKLMQRSGGGRIVNFATVATPLRLEGEAIYAASKAAIVSLTEVMARELAGMNILVNSIGPTPVKTDLIRSVPREKMDALLARQAIRRFGEMPDISNCIDFFIRPESDFITGQVIYLGGVQ